LRIGARVGANWGADKQKQSKECFQNPPFELQGLYSCSLGGANDRLAIRMGSPRQVIGIIGGQGKMGRWFARFFRMNGYRVLISDRHTSRSNQEVVSKSNIVLFSLPIGKTPALIHTLLKFGRTDQLWADLTSIKVPAVGAMLRSKAEVIGVHPMFGPGVQTLRGQTVIVTPARVKRWRQWFESLLKKNGARVHTMTADEHDRAMAIVQGLTHFSSILLHYTLMKTKTDIRKSLQMMSPIYRIQLNVGGRILAQNPQLYSEIQMLNPNVSRVLRVLVRSARELGRFVEEGNVRRFESAFQKAAAHMGDYKKTALEESNALIKAVSESSRPGLRNNAGRARHHG
jgi:prephenate dehydrogenase